MDSPRQNTGLGFKSNRPGRVYLKEKRCLIGLQ
jgi:hypothetical protein